MKMNLLKYKAIRTIVKSLLFLGFSSVLNAAIIPDFYQDSGINPTRSYLTQHPNEYIDPFTGSLQHHYVDLSVHGNGGFELDVVRAYNSSSINPTNPEAYNSLAGLGWTIHFGRVLKGSTNICANTNGGSVVDNPVLELPDGSRQLLVFTGSNTPLMLTMQRWRADCNTGSAGGLIVYSPEGTRYDMTQMVNVGVSASPTYAWYTTRITDKNGNYAVINYAGSDSPQINSVVLEDGQTINFTYADSGRPGRRITSISTHNHTYQYSYQSVSGMSDTYFLTRVQRPDGRAWVYNYHENLGDSAGSYLMNRVTYPTGGTINYSYGFVYFDTDANPASRSTVVTRKTPTNGGVWTFTYRPGNSTQYDTTTVSTPAGNIVYRHIGPNRAISGRVWTVGLPVSKQIGTIQTENYSFDKQKISNENYFRPGAFVLKVDAGATNAPVLIEKQIIRDGKTYTIDYSNFDSYGNPQTITESGANGGNRTTTLSYFINAGKWIINQLQNESSSGHSITRTMDDNGNVTSITNNGITTTYAYDSQGNLTTATFPRHLIHTYSQYKCSIPRLEHQPEDITISRVVNEACNITSETNGEGHTTTYAYDGLDRITSIGYPAGNSASISYGANSKTYTRGNFVENTDYDGFGHPTHISAGGISRTYSYDVLGRNTFISDPNSNAGTSYQYDILDRPTNITNADGTSNSIAYGAGSDVVTDERGQNTMYTYRIYGNPDQKILINVVAPESSTNISISRNTSDLITAITQGNVTRTYGYDAHHYLTSVNNPETGTTTYERDAAGNMISRQVSSSGVSHYTYDGQNRLIGISYPGDTPSVTQTYTRTNRLASTSANNIQRTYQYDANNNLTNETITIGEHSFPISYTYNGNDHLTSMTYPISNRTINYDPNVLGLPTQVSGYLTHADYWPSGQIQTLNYNNGVSTSYDQNNRLWPSRFTTQKNDSIYLNTAYGYDGVGNLLSINDNIEPQYNRTLTYDRINRLVTANGPWGASEFTYDSVGNITRQTLGSSGILSYAYDSQNRLNTVSGNKEYTYTYDEYGNIINNGAGATYLYDDASNLRCVNCADPQQKINYNYDGHNQRVSTTKAGVTTYEIYNTHGNLIAEYIPNTRNRLIEYFYLGNQRIAQHLSEDADNTHAATDTTTYFHNDISATPMLATTATGDVLWKENYRPYGEKVAKPAAGNNNKLWYAGKPYDEATGLSYMGARYYDPLLGRFVATDPEEVDPNDIHSFNRYTYANNNPYRYVDPDGHSPVDVGFLIHDYNAYRDAKKSGEGLKAAKVNLSISIAGVVNPLPGTSLVVKGGRAVVRGVARIIKAFRSSEKTLESVKEAEQGIVYMRTNRLTGEKYIGQSKSYERYLKRQSEHDRRLGSNHDYDELGRATVGKSLDVLEENMIRQHGGIQREGGTLANRRHQMSERNYRKHGDT